jgi:hypothetical protein
VLRALFVPPAPTSVTATAGNAQATVSWTAPTVLSQTPITDYTVQYSSNSGSSWTTVTRSASTATSATVTGLTNGTAYTFRAAAVNGVGTGAYSTASTAVTPAVPSDSYYSSVSLLLHADGTGGTFTDSSATAKTITVGGSATQSATQSKFGGKSAKLANGDYLSVISSTVLTEANNYVLEFWIYPLTQTQDDRFFTIENSSGDSRGFIIDGGGFCWNKFGFPEKPLTGTITNNQWQHVALVKSGSTTSLYIGGTRASTTTSAIFPTSPTRINWGASVTNYAYAAVNAYYDDIRITLGTDRGYTGSTITVPTAIFPDAGPMLAPTALSATGGNAQASLTWTAPSYNGGSSITDYSVQYSSDSGSTWSTFSHTASATASQVVTGLTNGTAYVFRVAGINSNGTGTYTAASSSVTPSTTTATLTSGGGLNSWRWNTANSYFDSYIYIGRWDDNTVQQTGWRTTFTPASKPSSISSATFTLPYTWITGATAFSVVLRGAKLANAGQSLQGTNLTTASATGNVTTSNGTLTIDCTTVIAEIIGQSGWTPGNSIVLYLSGENAASNKEIRGTDTDTGGSLSITY